MKVRQPMPTFQEWLARRPKATYGLISSALERPIRVPNCPSEVLWEPSVSSVFNKLPKDNYFHGDNTGSNPVGDAKSFQ